MALMYSLLSVGMKRTILLPFLVMIFISQRMGCRAFHAVTLSSASKSPQKPFGVRLYATEMNDKTVSGYNRPKVQWYPGHIAKAERQLQETMKAVDVVVEVRDARLPRATSHARVGAWCAGRPRIVVLTHVDTIPKYAQRQWQTALNAGGAVSAEEADFFHKQVQNQARQAKSERFKHSDLKAKSKIQLENGNDVEKVLFVNAKEGAGIFALTRAIHEAGAHIGQRRLERGLKERSLRVGIIGYPNVGKSALINRLLGRRRAKTANTPGVTRSLQWIRVRTDEKKKKVFELLDSPGIIPATLVDQSDAMLLAACNCIGQAAYDNQAVAAYLCEWLLALHRLDYQGETAPEWLKHVRSRYGLSHERIALTRKSIKDDTSKDVVTGEDMLFFVADNSCRGNPEDAARKILQDFRSGRWGSVCLQVAPATDGSERIVSLTKDFTTTMSEEILEQEAQERAQVALQTAKEQGLELPPRILDGDKDDDSSLKKNENVGKGLFDGW